MSGENPSTPPWTYRMEVSPTGQAPTTVPASNEPTALLHLMVNLQSQTLEMQRQQLEMQRQQLELLRETAQIARDQRARQSAELERWQTGHEGVLEDCRDALGKLEHAARGLAPPGGGGEEAGGLRSRGHNRIIVGMMY